MSTFSNIMIIGVSVLFIVTLLLILTVIVSLLVIRKRDKSQTQHAIRRNFPVLSRIRYLSEHIGPELRQYFFEGDHEAKPFSRLDFQYIVKAGKYAKNIIAFGSKRDFDKPGFYIRNAFFAKQLTDLIADNENFIATHKYIEDKDTLFARHEHREEAQIKPWLYTDADKIVIGKHSCRYPFTIKSPVAMSGMSYGALGDRAIKALSYGLKDAGAYMNTGEGGLSPHHLKGGADIMVQIGPAKFGFRNPDGSFSYDLLREKASHPQVKAFEIKLGQGAKIRGGHIEGSKVTPEIAEIRGVEPYKTIDSPNRFEEFDDMDMMMDFIDRIRDESGKPVGIKMVIGSEETFEEFAAYMAIMKRYPDFITIDGGEGGTGATYQAMADSVGLPIKPALMIAQRVLKKYNVRDKVTLIASGKLFSPDRIAIALSLGADICHIARGLMISVGCIGAQKCQSNECPVGVATTNPKLQKALVIEEKRYRVTNYMTTLREELFTLAAAAGLTSPRQFNEKHVVFVDQNFNVKTIDNVKQKDETREVVSIS
ncbi:FMN-binding glutamate synthase family protein [Bacillus sp. DTU_2020_1000418_1_SI_GHA_SEK_038]|uniref:FMN-binding glutamate synthase family protein n=1 Tax=Bacillus sp. DTU_2020_1000418_1_SI_GHA_SEK_038 TaxID=3077585 RepID=UPI0028F16E69|nr:FMN-binding glutamate synthase family protein [Bacillus sp. DTU_2020_1000418_1_SI_GHA_SEK_038]WNS73638.1 FMN-binding glutamate synthase family protein [Bacillus sp. DTU_2020_1000418_1_SI_GHA_SEK_038]